MDPHDELSFLVGGVRSLLEQLVDSGADYIPGDGKKRPRVQEYREPREAPPAFERPAPPPPARAPAPAPAPPARAPAPAPARSLPIAALDPAATDLRLSQIAQIV
ncbi:MAG: hypothetical protein ACXWP4_14300, partial [Polyangiales bacterium]